MHGEELEGRAAGGARARLGCWQVRCYASTTKDGSSALCSDMRTALSVCATRVLGPRSPLFTQGLDHPASLVQYRIATGQTILD
mmetsp:Transcript_48480/g.152053  ORF Transcript_48480/g.152053 Transcript_48480/m.152053 type:complete len:84 (-) Transcript_48480:2872-3123(-)